MEKTWFCTLFVLEYRLYTGIRHIYIYRYWAFNILAQIYTENHETFPIQIDDLQYRFAVISGAPSIFPSPPNFFLSTWPWYGRKRETERKKERKRAREGESKIISTWDCCDELPQGFSDVQYRELFHGVSCTALPYILLKHPKCTFVLSLLANIFSTKSWFMGSSITLREILLKHSKCKFVLR